MIGISLSITLSIISWPYCFWIEYGFKMRYSAIKIDLYEEDYRTRIVIYYCNQMYELLQIKIPR